MSPAEIANIVYQSRSSSTVRVYLSNGLYKYIEEMLSDQTGYSIKVKNWSRVTHILEKAGYKKVLQQIEATSNQINQNNIKETDFSEIKVVQTQDWGEAVDVSIFHGRTAELAQMTEWIVQEHCRLVVLLGMGGIGKTALSVKLAEEIKDKFEYVIWRCLGTSHSASTLDLAPPPDIFFNQLLKILSPTQQIKDLEVGDSTISQLINCLRSSRCLIILDNFDAILSSESTNELDIHPSSESDSNINNSSVFCLAQIGYRPGYEIYGELMRRVGDSQHQSCLVLTSREKPPQMAAIQGEKLPVRCLKLTGLSNAESREILKAKGFAYLKEEECKLLIDWYAGNPLFIKLIATAIQELFEGNIYQFLEQGTRVFGDIRAILDQQFGRLSSLEKLIMYWLSLNQDMGSIRKLQTEIIPRVPQRLILEAIELLQRRCLIERQASRFYQTPVLVEYVAERFIEENFKLMQEKPSSLVISYSIFEAQMKNYIRDIHLGTEI